MKDEVTIVMDVSAENMKRALDAAREEGRAAGYAEAIEKAAKIAEDAYVNVKSSHKGSYIAFSIRALLPAATKESK